MIDYDDLVQAVEVQDMPAVAKILDRVSNEELAEIQENLDLLKITIAYIINMRSLIKAKNPPSPCVREHCSVCGTV